MTPPELPEPGPSRPKKPTQSAADAGRAPDAPTAQTTKTAKTGANPKPSQPAKPAEGTKVENATPGGGAAAATETAKPTHSRRKRAGIAALIVLALIAVTLIIPPLRSAAGRATGRVADAVLSALPAPDVSQLLAHLPQRNRILAADNSVIAQTWWQDRTVVSTEAIAPVMRQAQIAIEDARFYEHASFDPIGLARAIVSNTTSGDLTGQGASTIQQQLAKNLVQLQAQLDESDAGVTASTDKSLSRKFDDLVLAAHLETSRSKDQILTDYLNVVYYGEGAYGVEAAARRYFGTTAAKLTLPQAALLAGLVQSPSADDPLQNPQAATDRRAQVLAAMLKEGYIDDAQYQAALAAPLGLDPVSAAQGCASSDHPQFCDFAVRRLQAAPELGDSAQARKQAWNLGGLTLKTTLDPTVQKATNAAIKAQKLPGDAFHDAAAVVRPSTGAVLALGQDVPYGTGTGRSTQSYALDAVDGGAAAFQAGSTFKTFTLAAAFANGYTPNSRIDVPESGASIRFGDSSACGGSTGGTWAPENVKGDPTGRMTLTAAFAASVNTAFAELESKVGVCTVRETAQALGARQSDGSELEPVAALTLGVDTTSPLTMAGAYAAFANNGTYCTPTPLASVTGAGRDATFAPQCRKAVDPDVAAQVSQTLRAVVRDGTGAAARISGVQVGGKTGTTDTSANTWFTGIAPDLAASVWVGDPAGGSYDKLYGSDVAAPLWRRIVAPVVNGN